ncbi:conserved membrane hypothetical protein [Frankia canadensis]|uniref:Integral membrane protein n=1 Tax=Frankia canadensis TaxID=1836972 RepID=A0A2I2KZJ6_9ACTN|nr:hypothetical protein [Frankia canadensis]SNQ51075.1 conserved membrane hypothetical protein [Frankia canadensis]SOU58365.1 conserved membrane hypothetical protein [Frankia canadensis]
MTEDRSRIDGIQVDLAEYEHLKAEQLGRIGVRDNLVYATLAACGGVVALAFSAGRERIPALLLLPPVCLVLGWTYLVNDQKVSAIGRYLRRVLGPRLGEGARRTSLGWETEHCLDAARRRRKLTQLGVELVLFCGSSVSALTVFWSLAFPIPLPLLTVSLVEAAVPLLLALEIVRCADTARVP